MAESGVELRDWLERAKERVDLDVVIGRRVQLKRQGQGFKGLCPFHPEKTPSFYVTPERGMFKCFGCGKQGDYLTFVQEIEGLDFWESLRALGEEAGMEVPTRFRGGRETASPVREEAREALRLAAGFYQNALAQAPEARSYLQNRGLSKESLDSFRVGWAPAEPGWLRQRLAQAGISQSAMLEAGLIYQAQGTQQFRDRFWDRVQFPVADAAGRTVGFGGRLLPGSRGEQQGMGKYVNSAEGPLFPKRRLLYGLDRLAVGLRNQSDRPILVCEGYLDVILLHQAGWLTALAALGTALTEEHGRRLKRFGRQVTLLLDADPAGRKAAARAARVLITEGVDVRVVELPEDSDPADMVSAGREQELSRRVADARDILEWRLETWSQKADFRVPAVQAKAAEEMAGWIKSTPSPALAEVWTRLACDRLGLREDSLREVGSPVQAPVPSLAKGAAPSAAPLKRSAREILQSNEREIVAALLLDPSLFSLFRDEVESLELRDSMAQKVLKWCKYCRSQGVSFDLDTALQSFGGDSVATWLYALRLQDMTEPRKVFEHAYRALPGNLEAVLFEERQRHSAPSDADLARYLRKVPVTANFADSPLNRASEPAGNASSDTLTPPDRVPPNEESVPSSPYGTESASDAEAAPSAGDSWDLPADEIS